MRIAILMFLLTAVAACSSSPKEEYQEQRAEAKEEYQDSLQQAEEEYKDNRKAKAIDMIEGSDDVQINGKQIQVVD